MVRILLNNIKSFWRENYFSFFYSFSKFLILALIIVLPFFPFGLYPDLSLSYKIFITTIIILIAFISLLLHYMVNKQIIVPDLFAFSLLILFLLISLLSSLLSSIKNFSIYGFLASAHSFISYLLYFLIFLIASVLFTKENLKSHLFIFSIIFLIANFLLFFSILSRFSLNLNIFSTDRISSLVILSFASFLFSILILLYINELEFTHKPKLVLTTASILNIIFSTLILISLNFNDVWLVSFFLILILLFKKYLEQTPLDKRSIILTILLIISAILYFFSPYLTSLISKFLQPKPVLEIRPSFIATMQVSLKSLNDFKTILIGNGPNSYLYSWLKYKPVELSQINTRFDQGFSYFSSLISESGFLGLSLILTVLLLVLAKFITTQGDSGNIIIGTLYSIFFISLFYYPLGFVNGIYLFYLLGILTSSYSKKEINFREDRKKQVLYFFILILFLIFTIYFLYLITSKFLAQINYSKAVLSYQRNNINDAINYIRIAISLDPQNDLFLRDASFLLIQRATQILSANTSTISNRDQNLVLNLIALSIDSANRAISINPKEPLNYNQLAYIYQLLGTSDPKAFDFSIKNYQKAIELDPNNFTYYLNIGLIYKQKGNKEEAQKYISKAYELSGDVSILNLLK